MTIEQFFPGLLFKVVLSFSVFTAPGLKFGISRENGIVGLKSG